MHKIIVLITFLSLSMIAEAAKEYDIVIRNGVIYDGMGGPPYVGDVAIQGKLIAGVGDLKDVHGKQEIDAKGLAISPGFINMLSQASDTLMVDGHSESDIRQGVTLEVFGEGSSMGPLNDTMKKEAYEQMGDITYQISWNTLGEWLDEVVKDGVSTNMASFIGATTVRIYVLGYEDRAPTAEELEKMKQLVRDAMKEGALGLGSSLIYAPAFYAKTDELVELCKAAAEYDGMYISHIRSEGNKLLEAIDELLHIAEQAKIRAEIYHFKAAGKSNWSKLDDAIKKVEQARKKGLKITADMYTYTAGATGLSAMMPPWVQEGGLKKWKERLQDPAIRERLKKEMSEDPKDWENLYRLAGGADNVLLVGFKNDKLKPLTGKTLAEVAEMRGKSPEETAMDLVVEDDSRVDAVYFMMSEENVEKEIALPWVSFGSDEASLKPQGVFLKWNPHPRAYGNFARLLGKYVNQEKIIPLEKAIRRLTSQPASNLKIQQRGVLKAGYFADIVLFDPDDIIDHATYDKPHQFSTGVVDVFVNGTQVLKDGQHTGATPGMVVHGPGYREK
jgi:N-acyl-D-amino-acid deacylase